MTKQEEIDEDDEKLLEAFLSKDARPQRTLADLIVDKIKEKDAQVSSGFFIVLFYISCIIFWCTCCSIPIILELFF